MYTLTNSIRTKVLKNLSKILLSDRCFYEACLTMGLRLYTYIINQADCFIKVYVEVHIFERKVCFKWYFINISLLQKTWLFYIYF